ncbi:MAG: carboxypeptidase regulatory-like domain-containing protein [Gammaproteobacteria bacterium]|nr:MAG: carboxypeptidase regulatory-like domain-containing protein [Gammaproteobacteria bacterium]
MYVCLIAWGRLMRYLPGILTVFCVFWLTGPAAASAISGTVYDDKGAPFADVPIQLINSETGGIAHETKTNPDGSYAISNVAVGVYKFSITMQCCAIASFTEEDLQLGADEFQFDVHMKQGDSLNTFGDDPHIIADLIRSRQIIPDLPVPQHASGKPDLSGVWLIGQDPFPATPKLTAWAAEITEQRVASVMRDAPHTRCLPQGMPIPSGAAPFMGKFVQTDNLLLILFEDVPGFRQIFLDGRAHPDDPDPTWMGHSTGHWDGDTLVVDTVGFNDRLWLGPHPVTEAMHMIERYRRTEYGLMELQVTYEDPAVFNEPLVQNRALDLAPQEELIEYVCENNKWAQYTESTDSG